MFAFRMLLMVLNYQNYQISFSSCAADFDCGCFFPRCQLPVPYWYGLIVYSKFWSFLSLYFLNQSLRDFAILCFHKFMQIQGFPAFAGCHFSLTQVMEFLHFFCDLISKSLQFQIPPGYSLFYFWPQQSEEILQDPGSITVFRSSRQKPQYHHKFGKFPQQIQSL